MHILLTDILTCPRCGPEFGLIVLADSVADRQVEAGHLGCANCRAQYPIRAGIADLRIEPTTGSSAELPERTPAGDGERALRLAALSGLGDRPGMMMVRDADRALVGEVARHLPHAQLFGASAQPPSSDAGPAGSWILHGHGIPLRDRSLFAVTLADGSGEIMEDAMRTVAPGGRIVVENASAETGPFLAGRGWTILLEQDGVAVASRPIRG